jgi:hypothetical protein
MTEEPDYTLTIMLKDDGWVVFEGGEQISRPFEDIAEAGSWYVYHRNWNQPRCIICFNAVTRPNDPWEAYSVSSKLGPDRMHRSCMEKFESWADDETLGPGPHQIPNMDVLDAAWRSKNKQRR